MPIQKVADRVVDIPIYGKIRLGKKVQTSSGSERPENSPTFILEECPEVRDVYGDNPDTLDIKFFAYDLEQIIPHHYELFGGGFKGQNGSMVNGQLWCRGDGNKAHVFKDKNHETGAVPCEQCPMPEFCQRAKTGDRINCKPRMRIRFILPKVHPLRVYQITTNSIVNIQHIFGEIQHYSRMDFHLPVEQRHFLDTVWKLKKVKHENFKYYDKIKGKQMTSAPFLLEIEQYDKFYVDNKQALIETHNRINNLYLPEFTLRDRSAEVPMIDNNHNTSTQGPAQQALSASEVLVTDVDLGALFVRLCKLKNVEDSPKRRLLTIRKYENAEDQKLETMKYLQGLIAAEESNAKTPEAPVSTPEVKTPEVVNEAPAGVKQAETNSDGII